MSEASAEAVAAETDGELPELAQEFVAALAREQELAQLREGVIERLHTEVEQLRRGEVEHALDVVRRPLIRLHDQIQRQAELVDAPLSVEDLRTLLRALADETADALAATGVDRYAAQVGEAYDSRRHRPVGRIPAASPEQDRTVGRAVSAGFEQGDRVVRKSEVLVTHWTP
ncbi:nucleotide exchange factor GrpE [Streptomyces sp. NBC_00876]|uniref:nucleotide exchange factor GrpE n=1 Tax=Streptomyces sp. NBC_00876 TaxID=2975853 RepID=UPI00386C150A|nr:nucleotide exchange factor GrpE [Streptomyces sp. NBC_00876]